jgi:hypothetical protein
LNHIGDIKNSYRSAIYDLTRIQIKDEQYQYVFPVFEAVKIWLNIYEVLFSVKRICLVSDDCIRYCDPLLLAQADGRELSLKDKSSISILSM